MGRGWRPILVGAAVVLGTFALAKAHPFEPSAPSASSAATGDATRGAVVFERECSGCHGPAGTGGGVGPTLAEAGLDTATVTDSGGAGPRDHARRSRQRAGGGGRGRLRRVDLDPVQLGSRHGGRGTDRPPAARGDVRHRPRADRLRGRRSCRGDARGYDRLRGGRAGRPLWRVHAVGDGVHRRARRARRRRPVRARGRRRAARVDRRRAGGEVGTRRCAPRPPGEAPRRSRVQAAGAAANRASDLLDDLARRPGRHGTARRAGGGDVPPAQAQARRWRRPRCRACSGRPRRDRPAAHDRRQRVVVPRRGARRAPAARGDRRRVLRAAAPRRRRGRHDA